MIAKAILKYARRTPRKVNLVLETIRGRNVDYAFMLLKTLKQGSKEEVSKVRQETDPIDTLRERILGSGAADEAQLKEIDREVKVLVTAAAEFAQQSPEPDTSELFTDILLEA